MTLFHNRTVYLKWFPYILSVSVLSLQTRFSGHSNDFPVLIIKKIPWERIFISPYKQNESIFYWFQRKQVIVVEIIKSRKRGEKNIIHFQSVLAFLRYLNMFGKRYCSEIYLFFSLRFFLIFLTLIAFWKKKKLCCYNHYRGGGFMHFLIFLQLFSLHIGQNLLLKILESFSIAVDNFRWLHLNSVPWKVMV